MAYESESFIEHHEARLPLLATLQELGWARGQIVCPSPNSEDVEWRIPTTPSEASKREAGQRFKSTPCDIAIFDSAEHAGEWDHLVMIAECKAPNVQTGISQLETYLAREPHARAGIWHNGSKTRVVYKRADGTLKIDDSGLVPKPEDNLILAGKTTITGTHLRTPTTAQLRACFKSMLSAVVSTESKSTRREDQLAQLSNMLLLKLSSDRKAEVNPSASVEFQLFDTPGRTAKGINDAFVLYKQEHPALFSEEEPDVIVFDNDTIQHIVLALQGWDLGSAGSESLSLAFQVFRDASLKLGDGQYYTPLRVIEVCTKLMQITPNDKIIDPACGTGGFLCEAFLEASRAYPERITSRWAHDGLYGIDRDKTNIKLTRALMVGIGDGSSNAYLGDSLRTKKWVDDIHGIRDALKDGSYSVVLTNPPFGKQLKLTAVEARESGYSICRHGTQREGRPAYSATELGIVFVERAWHLLRQGGCLGIVLPETYFFSPSYAWFRDWLDNRFILRGVLNIPMEAFQGFCRAKTNFYVLEKCGADPSNAHRPSWFRDGEVWVSNAPTIGLNKDGESLYCIDNQGRRTSEIDDLALDDVLSLIDGAGTTQTSRYVPYTNMSSSFVGVPKYSSNEATSELEAALAQHLPHFVTKTLGELIDMGEVEVRCGHGSPSADLRSGGIPYIKVSDLRAGLVNINPNNMVSLNVARTFWRSDESGLKAWDILTPSRASKNIGEASVLLPGQEDVVLTKEILVFRTGAEAPFDQFYLAWALSNPSVLKQWQRIIFMQTNREDVGKRYKEIRIPYPPNKSSADKASEAYRTYLTGLGALRKDWRQNRIEL